MTTPIEALEAALSVMQDAPKSVLRDCAIGEVEQVLASLEGDAVERVARIMVRSDPNYCTYHMPGDTPRDWKATSGYRGKTSELSESAAEGVRVRARAILATGLVADESATALTEAFAALTEARAEIEVLKIEKNEAFKIGHLLFDAKNSWEHRAIAAESELSTLRARVREVVGPFASRVPARSFRQPDGTMVARAGIQIEYFRAARQLMEDLK